MNESLENENTDNMSIYGKSENILADIQTIIETAQNKRIMLLIQFFPRELG